MSSAPIADRSVADDLCSFIDASPTPYHAVETTIVSLIDDGFVEVDLAAAFPREVGAYFVRRGGSLVAWRQSGAVPDAVRILGAHTDSPNLRIKPVPDLTSSGVRQLGVEVYGGVLLNTWLDRDLGLAGRVSVRSDDGPISHLIRVDEPLLRVPQLAIHLDRSISTDGLQLNPQLHLVPMWDLEGATTETFTDFVAARLDVDAQDVLAWDLMMHDLTPSTRSGRDGVFVSAPRLDNLCSSFAAIRAIVAAQPHRAMPVVCLYDHEEVGSTSATGADSLLLVSVLERIVAAADGGRDELHAALASSFCVSADMAHATHPNYQDRHDPQHVVALNGGPVIKVNASQRYASDAESIADFVEACATADVPTQHFVGRNDLPCGSTIGPTTAARLGVRTVDVGVAQLAMHSARELCGADDPGWYVAAMTAFLER